MSYICKHCQRVSHPRDANDEDGVRTKPCPTCGETVVFPSVAHPSGGIYGSRPIPVAVTGDNSYPKSATACKGCKRKPSIMVDQDTQKETLVCLCGLPRAVQKTIPESGYPET